MAEDLVSHLSALLPELLGAFDQRRRVLETVGQKGTVGRRTLVAVLHLPERTVRAEVESLRTLGLLRQGDEGISITAAGSALLAELNGVASELHGTRELGATLSGKLGVPDVRVVPGDFNTDPSTATWLSHAAAQSLVTALNPRDILAVGGGTTSGLVASALSPDPRWSSVSVVPTGGGLGDRIDVTPDAVAARMARQLGAKARLLFLPADLPKPALEAVIESDPRTEESLTLIKSASIVLFGVGSLETVAQRRTIKAPDLQALADTGSVGEMLGCFFDETGAVVRDFDHLGLRAAELGSIPARIMVAAGVTKAKAILGAVRLSRPTALVTDESAARSMLDLT